jgi:hypothetical protein
VNAGIRRLQRDIDRQRREQSRQTSPGRPREEGLPNGLRSLWQLQSERRSAEMHRYEAVLRSQAHGLDTNFLLSKALTWRDEGVCQKSLQRRFGRCISVRASGHFMSESRRRRITLFAQTAGLEDAPSTASAYEGAHHFHSFP